MNNSLLYQIITFILKLLGSEVSQTTKSAPEEGITYRLVRKEFRDDGIFSELFDNNGILIAHTLEHSYDKKPKIYNGTFKCVRGPHRLHNMTEDFITFEITGVQGHVDLLYHWGNFNENSDGCILMGAEVTQSPQGQMVTNSRETFAKFMDSLQGVNEFSLTVY